MKRPNTPPSLPATENSSSASISRLNAALRGLRTGGELRTVEILLKPLGKLFWALESRRSRLQDRIDNERSGR